MSWGVEPILIDAVPELEPTVLDEQPRFDEAVVDWAVLDPAAAAALAQVGEVDPAQSTQGDDLRQVEGASVFHGQDCMKLIETRDPFLEVQQIAFMAGGDDDVEVEVEIGRASCRERV